MLDERIIESCKSHIRNLRGFDRSEFVSVEKGRFEMRAYPGADCANEYDNVHGGFLLALADEAASGAADTYGYDNATMTVWRTFFVPPESRTSTCRSWLLSGMRGNAPLWRRFL